MKSDVARSSSSTFGYLYDSEGAKDRFTTYLGTIDERADFFGASNLYESNLGIGAKWFEGAEFVSRAPLTGLGADGHGSFITFAAGLGTMTNIYGWRNEAGNTLILGGFDNFKALFDGKYTDAVVWDIGQLKNEQGLLQPVHEKYLEGHELFQILSNIATDTDWGVGVVPFTSEQQGVKGGVDILDYKSRVEFGCKLLGYSAAQGCSP